ncbi:hypothetical protein JYU34_013395 [Plutella xylostella]|uniref:SWIM-type domain-containing protein n=1 Tax=Plutella xylostella TaxID=51655 RepID=A0ABQ7Q9T8_PLUXY|nr:hypothetical protein JYU34_013395 [Plutella xylostella]
MLLEYMHRKDVYNAAEIRGAKVLMSSRDSYVEAAIGYVEVKRENGTCTIKARVTPEHRVHSKMYSVFIELDEIAESIINVHCEDCAASAGGCKHGICFIHWLIKRTEEPSVTDITCYWKKPKLSEAVSSETPLPAAELGKRKTFAKIQSSITLQSVLEECKKRKVTKSLLYNYSKFKEDDLKDYSVFNLLLNCYNTNAAMDFDMVKRFGEDKLTSDITKEIEQATRNQVDDTLWHILS